ncbi:peptide chain release factor N(5)-glutamine methyltransferase [Pelosinus sp. UFO1]|uniref:peptide chain release factor N(5)-glutamine methyltransferase n=1 Tax=Pelosinus sp. UFO1 TaxID=484770 RepID=UPI0004D1E320|nr:peptide chain release factor N(5)-glutamine methyltransferase [Pelosinus sp. UFO1]AIF53830.1 Protein-(glutamine-N5) methyltransferase, release factor-specific [Pelosinus sp. UFO1]
MENKKEIWTIQTILNWTRQYFLDKGVENPRLDAEVLLSHILDKERLYLYVHFDQPLEEKELAAFRVAVKKRAARLPVAYIIGVKEFMGLDFEVTPAVLIPRPDTEILVEAALKRLSMLGNPYILDIGTGSGAICVSMLANLPTASGVTVDISAAALDVAKKNAMKHQVHERLTFCQGDLFAPVEGQQFTAILSNPPYIPEADIRGLTPEVRQEPNLALDGGQDGLDFYRRIIKEGRKYLVTGGFIVMEVGIGQAQLVANMAEKSGDFKLSEIIKDYGGIERVVVIEGL